MRGSLGADGPKSVQPIAARLGRRGPDQLHHFVSSAAWDDAPLWRVLAAQADGLVGGPDAVLVIDDTGVPKKGTLSVGVAAPYRGELGKQANCQSLVSLTLARHEVPVPVPVGLRLFLPRIWTDDPARCAAAGVPEAARAPQTRPEIALAEIDRVIAAGIRFGCALADAGYGLSAPFRPGLSARSLTWSVGLPRQQKVGTTEAKPVWPNAGRGRPRQPPVPSETGQDAASALARRPWRRIAWRQGTKGVLAARFAALRVRVADGPTVREAKHLPGDEAWLIGEWRSSGERQFSLSNPPPRTALRTLAATTGRDHQGALGLRAGASAAQAGTRPRRFRGKVVDRAASTRAYELHCIRLSAKPAAQGRGQSGGKSCRHLPRHRDRRSLKSDARSSNGCSKRQSH